MFCPKCGRQVSEKDGFCSSCGTSLKNDNAYARQPQSDYYNQQTSYQQEYAASNLSASTLIQQLCGKIQTEAIVWIVIASIQVVIALFNIGIGMSINSHYYSAGEGTTNIVSGLFILIVAITNFVFSAKDFRYAKRIVSNPVGIVKKYQPVGGLIATMIWNFFMGGIIGVVGSIFCFITRNFVIQNQSEFEAIETHYVPFNHC